MAIQNVSAILVPDSLAASDDGVEFSVSIYFLIYYQEREAVILAPTALNIVQVCHVHGIND